MTTTDMPTTTVRFKGRSTSIEWPTVLLGAVIVACFGGVTLAHDRLPSAATIALLAVVSGWWSSFQHELIHGHPFPSQRINDAIGSVSISLWIPYRTFKRTHLRHHRDGLLTDPLEDPESYYCDGPAWQRAGKAVRALMWINRTFAGRMLVGPPVAMFRFLTGEVRSIAAGDRVARREWLAHVVPTAIVCGWVFGIARVPVWQYLLGACWFGSSVFLIRSFVEHRWQPDGLSRSAFVEGVFPFGLLFLFNNYHHAHHARPNVPWYQYPALALHLDSRGAAKAGAGYYRGYREVLRLYLVRPFCIPVYPAAPEAGPLMRSAEGDSAAATS